MSQNIYKTAYLSLTTPLTSDLLTIQQDVCERYALIPRVEAHVTIAFFGETNARKLLDLASSLLDNLPSPAISEVHVSGLGGAYEVAGKPLLIGDKKPHELSEFPRVLWIALDVHEELRGFRKWVRQAAESIGISTNFMEPDFYPHLTLGSGGPSGLGNWTLWDVHRVEKRATLKMALPFEKLKISKLHLTDLSIHPDSIHLLRGFND